MTTLHPILMAGLIVGAFTLVSVSVVVVTHQATESRIEDNQRLSLLDKLHALVPANWVDNDLTADIIQVPGPAALGGREMKVYRGRQKGQPVALILAVVAPDGYAGPIQLLVAVKTDGTLAGVRVLSHQETPGLGDRIEEQKSGWVLGLMEKSLDHPAIERWKVKRDGGDFDQFTGATVTPRAVVKAVKNTLLFVKEQQASLFLAPSPPPPQEKHP
ncbi:MAG: electron transport complex subunit RsxG [Pseudomonadota bacterium]